MLKYLLAVFLSLPFLWAGPLETFLSIPLSQRSDRPEATFSSSKQCENPSEAIELNIEENENEEEEEEDESLHHSGSFAHLVSSSFSLPATVSEKVFMNTPRLVFCQNRTFPSNKAPPV